MSKGPPASSFWHEAPLPFIPHWRSSTGVSDIIITTITDSPVTVGRLATRLSAKWYLVLTTVQVRLIWVHTATSQMRPREGQSLCLKAHS